MCSTASLSAHTGVTIAYAPGAVSTRPCYFPGAYTSFNKTWTAINYNDFYSAPSDGDLLSRYHECYPHSSTVTPSLPPMSSGLTSPVISIPNHLSTLDPSWKGCLVGRHAFDPPRALESVTALGDIRHGPSQPPSAIPAFQATPIHPSITSTISSAIPSSAYATQEVPPTQDQVNQVQSPIPTSLPAVKPGSRNFAIPQPPSDRAGEKSDVKPSTTDSIGPVVDHSLQELDAVRRSSAQVQPSTASQVSSPRQSHYLPSIAGYEIRLAPDGGIIFGTISVRPEGQTTVAGTQLAPAIKGVISADSTASVTQPAINAAIGSPKPASPTTVPQLTISVGTNEIILDGSTYLFPPTTRPTSFPSSNRLINATFDTAFTPALDVISSSSSSTTGTTNESIFAEISETFSPNTTTLSAYPFDEAANRSATSSAETGPTLPLSIPTVLVTSQPFSSPPAIISVPRPTTSKLFVIHTTSNAAPRVRNTAEIMYIAFTLVLIFYLWGLRYVEWEMVLSFVSGSRCGD